MKLLDNELFKRKWKEEHGSIDWVNGLIAGVLGFVAYFLLLLVVLVPFFFIVPGFDEDITPKPVYLLTSILDIGVFALVLQKVVKHISKKSDTPFKTSIVACLLILIISLIILFIDTGIDSTLFERVVDKIVFLIQLFLANYIPYKMVVRNKNREVN